MGGRESEGEKIIVVGHGVMEGGERKSREMLERGERKCLFGSF